MEQKTRWTKGQASLVERLIYEDSYKLLLDRLTDLENRAISRLAGKGCDWEETNYLRGKIAGLAEFHPETIMREVEKSRDSEKPLGGSDA